MEAQAKIVVGVDGSPSSRQALRWAARQGKLTAASLEVISCWEFPTSYLWETPPTYDDPGGDVKRKLQATITDVLGDDPGLDIEVSVIGGKAATVLVDAARGASLLVVGSRGHGAFTGMLLGSVSEHCVRHAPCPVTVVREAGGHDTDSPV